MASKFIPRILRRWYSLRELEVIDEFCEIEYKPIDDAGRDRYMFCESYFLYILPNDLKFYSIEGIADYVSVICDEKFHIPLCSLMDQDLPSGLSGDQIKRFKTNFLITVRKAFQVNPDQSFIQSIYVRSPMTYPATVGDIAECLRMVFIYPEMTEEILGILKSSAVINQTFLQIINVSRVIKCLIQDALHLPEKQGRVKNVESIFELVEHIVRCVRPINRFVIRIMSPGENLLCRIPAKYSLLVEEITYGMQVESVPLSAGMHPHDYIEEPCYCKQYKMPPSYKFEPFHKEKKREAELITSNRYKKLIKIMIAGVNKNIFVVSDVAMEVYHWI